MGNQAGLEYLDLGMQIEQAGLGYLGLGTQIEQSGLGLLDLGTHLEQVGGNPFEPAVDNPGVGTLEHNLAEDNPDLVVGVDTQNLVEESLVVVLGNPWLGILALALDFQRTVGQHCCIQRYDRIVAGFPLDP